MDILRSIIKPRSSTPAIIAANNLLDLVTDAKENLNKETEPKEEDVDDLVTVYHIPSDISYFKPTELYNAKDTDLVDKTMDEDFMRMLNAARHIAGNPWKVNSGKRSKEWNAKVGGKANSSHLRGKAADINAPTGAKKFEIVKAAIEAGFPRIGINKSFIHLDNDTSLPNPTLFLY